MILSAEFKYYNQSGNQNIISRIQSKVAHFEDELPKLKEATTMLELALWKLRMNEKPPREEVTHCQKKIKTNESSVQRLCQITCGADVASDIYYHMLAMIIYSI